jgi:retinol dehydrogenase-14
MAGVAKGATILISGATSGIGRATALGLAAHGPGLVLLARDHARGEDVATLARAAGATSAEVLDCDLSLMASVSEAVAEFKRRHDRLDVLINDAAVFLGRRDVTSEGRERMLATNYLGPFLLTNLLLDPIAAAAPSRVINVTAPATTAPDPDDLDGEHHFSPVRAFGRSKAADLMFTYALARRGQARGISVCAYHPGVTRTPLMKDAPPLMKGIGAVMSLTARTPEKAAKGLIDLALSPAFEGVTGRLLHDGETIKAPFIDDLEAQERMWSASERLVGIRRQG